MENLLNRKDSPWAILPGSIFSTNKTSPSSSTSISVTCSKLVAFCKFKENLNSVYRSVARKIKKEVKDGLRPDTDVEPEALASMRRVLFTIAPHHFTRELVKMNI